MKQKIVLTLGVLLLCGAVGAIISADTDKTYYVCNCKDDCKCDFLSKKPGKCNCGTSLAAMHVLAIEKGSGVFCSCGGDCSCERSKSDPSKCGCGKPVKMVGLKGKYICDCGPTCNCLTISAQPGKCKCGHALKQVS